MNASAQLCLLSVIGLLACGCDPEDKATGEKTVEQSTAGDAIVAKLDAIVIPAVDFEDASAEEAIEFLRLRSIELDPDREPTQRGVSFIVRQPRVLEDGSNPHLNAYSASLDYPVNYVAQNVRILEVLSEVARQGKLDAYLTSVGIIVTPEGEPPFPNPKAIKGEVWKVLRRAE